MSNIGHTVTDKSSNSAPRFSVIVVNYKSVDRLRICLKSLCVQTWSSFEVIVVNNDPDERIIFEMLASKFDDCRFSFYSTRNNLGFAGGVNHGAELARGVWIATLNPDAYANSDWLEQAAATIDASELDVTMLASVQLLHANKQKLDGVGDCYAPYGLAWRGGHGHRLPCLTKDIPVLAPCGAAAFYRRDVFVAAQGYCERFFCYLEDVDLALRLQLRGGKCLLVARALVTHEGGISSGGNRSAFAVYQGMRNMPQAFLRCVPLALLLPMLPVHIVVLATLLIRHAVGGCSEEALSGLLQALKAIPEALSERRTIQRHRTVSLMRFASVLSWNPLDPLLRRMAVSLRAVDSG